MQIITSIINSVQFVLISTDLGQNTRNWSFRSETSCAKIENLLFYPEFWERLTVLIDALIDYTARFNNFAPLISAAYIWNNCTVDANHIALRRQKSRSNLRTFFLFFMRKLVPNLLSPDKNSPEMVETARFGPQGKKLSVFK